MKKTLIIALAALLTGSAAMAQEEKPAHFKLYGLSATTSSRTPVR